MKFIYLTALAFVSSLSLLGQNEENLQPKEAQVFFSPQDHLDQKLISLIDKESVSIRAAIFCLTHRDIIKALLEAKKRGVHVEVIIDKFTIKAKAPIKRMAQGGITIYVWDPQTKTPVQSMKKQKTPLMHNKFCLFESQQTVWSGSFNFTFEGASSNQENAIILKEDKNFGLFKAQFTSIKEAGCKSWKDYLATSSEKKSAK